MREGLDETLARMARREEALRRRAIESSEPAGREPGAHRVEPEGLSEDDPVQAVVEAVHRVVAGRPGLAVSVRVEQDGATYPLRIAWAGGEVTVTAEPAATPPPPWPTSARTVPAWTPGQRRPGPDRAARLADLIRRDPSLLNGPDTQR
ncbi:hypothetical protein [Micromonospora sp. WMMD812]|uniref:hypothetical protein n=1 Tax=Micromonospora sp. WMMD812 TaxID=3015152 RepID=UPI00248BEE09|nr:hypothetical protein [Micromonospora sp. WMMD812]WBB66144.1 hypothetical protein O7603_23660 [Micromonospora sp. WMMD812]